MDQEAGASAASPTEQRRLAERLPTGAKVFLILSAALLPLAIIAFFASLRTTQIADDSTRAALRIASVESARKVGIELIGDMTALRVALNALDTDAADAPSCARAQGVFAPQVASGSRFVISDAKGRPICGAALPDDISVKPSRAEPIAARVIPGRGVTLAISGATSGNRGRTHAEAFFPASFLARTAKPSAFAPDYEAQILGGGETLTLFDLPPREALERRGTLRIDLGIGDLVLQTRARSAPITSPVLIAMLLPIVMWAAAAGIAWLVVDRLLIRPLRSLRASVASFTPGEEINPDAITLLPAQEIRELGDTFRAISRTVAEHEAGLAEGLVRQTKLTREVHHRVKNNLQVISSLINFHARGARSAEATAAYASIQRRVDALAVVHRHHFAELEVNRGLSLRSVIGELASNIRATAPEGATKLSIAIEIAPVLATQDIAIAISFLVTEIVELSMTSNPSAPIRISVREGDTPDRAILRVVSPGLIDGDALQTLIAERYGRVIEGLSRQLRSKLHYDPFVGAYEIAVAITGRD
ncbi:histidine kinase dimerization/phosphoacceptor domain -containing protein [Sphingomonas sp. H39-1-10]|uniref:sensor histidine kinase n=1 Tax=Sphingomonas pollutisoli TaxID=3030829 RepID=UPI0023B986C2|nr:histidine kinase dimerization/phosphoacceptor domain -containing protein [Sphingomonas pollutisoli]MDF0489103.1 histidine kinase dimerization/phosphoacceptor domain -containing protein [Sphingomonas pollutisoli]